MLKRIEEMHRRAAEEPVVPLAEAFKLALIVGATLAVLAIPAKADRLASCDEIGEAAAEIMTYRQDAVPLSVLMDATAGAPFVQAMLLRAYSFPAAPVGEERDRIVDEFRNAEERLCRLTIESAS